MRRNEREQLGAGLVRRHLDELKLAADGPPDRLDLTGVGYRLGPGEPVGGALVAVVEESPFGDGGDVVLDGGPPA
ncbi:hypothetical protein AB0D37_11410 [Streptomyces sp. NPDC048384]|uniref:hypothetical protein n=1 Tax=unclassified Streptomyces TaxID=2593676 RepID=UPI003430D514